MVTPACQKTDQHKWITKTKVGGARKQEGGCWAERGSLRMKEEIRGLGVFKYFINVYETIFLKDLNENCQAREKESRGNSLCDGV